ncbi:glutamate racemase [bacterium]|nr:glutamate racemase [bacterium]
MTAVRTQANSRESVGPIGIFDSGIGGLTVAAAIRDRLPGVSLLYFGDTAHMPYGDKSEDAIRYYSIRIAHYLLKNKAKAIVIACNTASSIASRVVEEFVDGRVPVYNVIDPVVDQIAQRYPNGKVGVIGTKATVRTAAYAKGIASKAPNCDVRMLATPLLAPMIEEGFFNNNISTSILKSYLSNRKLKGIEALVLGCTHYPLIRSEMAALLGEGVELMDSAQLLAAELEKEWGPGAKAASAEPKHRFVVSDYTDSFAKTARLFFGRKVHLTEESLWGN